MSIKEKVKKGVKEKEIKEVKEEEIDRCAICLDYQNCDSIIMECCNKLIHSYCLSEWLTRRNNCPLCRTEQSSKYNYLSNDEVSDVIDVDGIFSSIRESQPRFLRRTRPIFPININISDDNELFNSPVNINVSANNENLTLDIYDSERRITDNFSSFIDSLNK